MNAVDSTFPLSAPRRDGFSLLPCPAEHREEFSPHGKGLAQGEAPDPSKPMTQDQWALFFLLLAVALIVGNLDVFTKRK